MKLTPKQARFVEEYLVDLNATAAAKRAGYSERTAHRAGAQNMQKYAIATQIQAALAKRSKRTEITADRVIKEIARLALSDAGQLFDEEGRLRPIHEIPEDLRRAVASVEVVRSRMGDDDDWEQQTHKIKLWDKNAALEKLCKHLALYAPERHEHNVEVSDAAEARARLLAAASRRRKRGGK